MDERHHEMLAQVASMYYESELTQSAVGKELGLSRVKVYRLLKEARAEGVVQITVDWPMSRDGQLEQALKRSFGLRDALVLKSAPEDGGHAVHRLGQLGARYLERALDDGMTLTVCLGRSTYEVINAIRPGFQAKVHVAQALGSMPFAMQQMDSPALARQLAQKLGGEVIYLSSPMMADSTEAAAIMRRQSGIERTLSAAREADVALLGIGNLDPDVSGIVKAGFMTSEDLIELRNDGAAGDIAGRVFTADGELHPCPCNDRVIGVTLDELRDIPTTLAVAMGANKDRAILGALRTGVVNVLCTDDQAASAVLTLEED